MRIKLNRETRVNLKRIRVSPRVGDTVKVTVGSSRKKVAKIISIRDREYLSLEGISKMNSKGIERPLWIHHSNVILTSIGTGDKRRRI